MNTVNLELSRRQLEILYGSFKRYLDPETTVLVPEDATLDEMNELSERLKKEINKSNGRG
ncbi:MAG: hypothetical protein ACM3X1_01085 [Ignavibacteriales bacterium]